MLITDSFNADLYGGDKFKADFRPGG